MEVMLQVMRRNYQRWRRSHRAGLDFKTSQYQINGYKLISCYSNTALFFGAPLVGSLEASGSRGIGEGELIMQIA